MENTLDVATIVQLLIFVTNIKKGLIMVNKKTDKTSQKKVTRKVKKSGLVKLKPKITATRPKDRSLIAEHIAEATGKGKVEKPFFLIRLFIKIRDKIREWKKL